MYDNLYKREMADLDLLTNAHTMQKKDEVKNLWGKL